ncbi:hypothetical protein C8R43DRAFT_1242645 [Mycena crocata]|nr:hypothetical protein C8R43DRAFT_1242645 [Mycena crocata]
MAFGGILKQILALAWWNPRPGQKPTQATHLALVPRPKPSQKAVAFWPEAKARTSLTGAIFDPPLLRTPLRIAFLHVPPVRRAFVATTADMVHKAPGHCPLCLRPTLVSSHIPSPAGSYPLTPPHPPKVLRSPPAILSFTTIFSSTFDSATTLTRLLRPFCTQAHRQPSQYARVDLDRDHLSPEFLRVQPLSYSTTPCADRPPGIPVIVCCMQPRAFGAAAAVIFRFVTRFPLPAPALTATPSPELCCPPSTPVPSLASDTVATSPSRSTSFRHRL